MHYPSGKKSFTGSWRQQLADATGTRYKPEQQEEEAWQDTSGVYDTDGNLLSIEDYADDVDSEIDNKGDDDEWSDDFDDNDGLVEDQEIFNLDTGWSIENFVADAPDVAADDHKVAHIMCSFLASLLSVYHCLEVHVSMLFVYCFTTYIGYPTVMLQQ